MLSPIDYRLRVESVPRIVCLWCENYLCANTFSQLRDQQLKKYELLRGELKNYIENDTRRMRNFLHVIMVKAVSIYEVKNSACISIH